MNTPTTPLVSVCIVTYQHARFIAQAIEGALRQKTEFPFEILIGEDGSTDGTREICQQFATEYPDRIRLFLRRREDAITIAGRTTGRFNFLSTLRSARGRYIAFCDGDDFWTDALKLSRQVALMERDPGVVLTFHETLQLHPDGRVEKTCLFPDGARFEQDDLIFENFIPNVSVCFRRPPDWALLDQIGDAPIGDWILHALVARSGQIAFDASPMAVYRLHPAGFWQQLSAADRQQTIDAMRRRVMAVLPRPREGMYELWARDQRRLDWLRQQTGNLEKELTSYQRMCASLQKWNRELEQSQSWHTEQVSSRTGRIAELECQALQQAEAVRAFHQEHRKLQQELENYRSELEATQSWNKALQESVEWHRHQHTSLTARLAYLEEQQAALGRAHDQLATEKATADAVADHAQQEIVRQATRIAELDRALDLEFIQRRDETARAALLARQIKELQDARTELEALPWFKAAAAAAAHVAWEEAEQATVSSTLPHCIEQTFGEPCEHTRVYHGWAFAPDDSVPEVRARLLTASGQTAVRAQSHARPDVAAAYPHSPEAGQAGFEIVLPLPTGNALVLLELHTQSGWIPFFRENLAVTESPLNGRSPASAVTGSSVSVIIPCYNYGQFVMDAVASALAQTWPAVEVIVIDDGSTDATTCDTLDRISHPRVRVLRTPNRGLPAARNHGIRAATAEFVCCLDADDKLAPTYLEKCLFLMAATGADIAGSWQQNFGMDDSLHRPGGFSMRNLWSENRLINAAVYPRALWEICSGYDETLVVGYEDWEFWIRCASLGARAVIVPEALFFYRKHGPSMLDRVRARHDEVVAGIRRRHYAGTSRTVRRDAPVPSHPEDALESLLAPFPLIDKSRPRVVLALPWLVLGGVDTLLSQICRHLTGRGFRVIIVTTEPTIAGQGDTTPLFAALTREIYHLPQFLPHAHWSPFLHYLMSSRSVSHVWLAGSAFVYGELPALHDHFPRLQVFDLLFNTEGHTTNNRRYAHHLDLTLCENESIRQWLLTHDEWPERIRLVPNGVDLNRFRPADRATARECLAGVRPDAFVVGFLGRFSHEKAPDAFVHLAAKFSADREIQFVLAGAGPIEAGLRQLAEELGADNLLWPGVVDSATALPAFDLLVLPSRLDGRPNAVLEAMACGIPVIASRVGGLPELVDHGVTGFLVESLDLAMLTEAVSRLRQDPVLRGTMGRAARARAEQHFDLQQALETYENLFAGGVA